MNRKISTLLIVLGLTFGLANLRAFSGKAAGASSSLPPVAAEKPINQYTYLATHNAIASYAYGFNLQNSQRYDVTTQLNGGARMMEIDIVYDTPDDKHPAGVYICHCGDAPHSSSKIELQRAKTQDMKSKVPLPNWSNGGKYIRFSTILKQIDAWMTTHPNEIVFIMTQNNSATVAQFDTEVAAAGLKTGTYVKPAGAAWPIKSELVKSNKRLILLPGDGVDLSTSKYANSTSLISWKGWLKPKIYGAKNDFNPAGAASDAFLVVGSFDSIKTDAITSRYYNDYDELSKRKAEWTAQGFTRFPTFIQVNQIQVGDALKFVNEMNDAAHQVTASLPRDAAGDWIVNASADIGSAFYSVGEYFTGEAIPTGSRGIYFKNEAGYVARMTVVYYVNQTVNGKPTQVRKDESTDKLTAGMKRPILIPADIATDKPIAVSIEAYGTSGNSVFSTTVPTNFADSVCYKAWGTIVSPKGGKCD